MDFRDYLLPLLFIFGILVGDVYNKLQNDIHLGQCGTKPGHTTLVTHDDGELICIYRQDGWPYKTLSGRNV